MMCVTSVLRSRSPKALVTANAPDTLPLMIIPPISLTNNQTNSNKTLSPFQKVELNFDLFHCNEHIQKKQLFYAQLMIIDSLLYFVVLNPFDL